MPGSHTLPTWLGKTPVTAWYTAPTNGDTLLWEREQSQVFSAGTPTKLNWVNFAGASAEKWDTHFVLKSNSISSSITGGYVAGRHATYEKEVFPEFTQSFQELTQQLFE